jgi:hypothetical protein
MAIYYVASIAPVAYPVFYDLSDRRLPETFEEWRLAETLARRDLVARGHHVVGLPVEAVGFRDHCRSLNCRADGVALTNFATRVGNDRFGTNETYRAVRARTVVVEDTRAGPEIVEEIPSRRHWWQFWKPRVAERRRVVVEDARVGPIVVGDVPPRRHWWQFWRRPRLAERTRPLAARPV